MRKRKAVQPAEGDALDDVENLLCEVCTRKPQDPECGVETVTPH